MKNIFKGFHSVDQKKLWDEEQTLFVFDANVFLNLYGYAAQTRNDFFNILDSIKGNLWVPYHAGLEYQRRRLSVIKDEKNIFNEIENNLDTIQNVFKGDFEKLSLKQRFPKLFDNTKKLEKEINKSISNYKKSVSHWNANQPCVRSHDSIRDKINEFFDGKVGSKPESQTWLDTLYEKGAQRFEHFIPPGFKDAGKAKNENEKCFSYDGLNYEKQYGDLIIWKQLIAKASDENIKNVVFITDDTKEDWWYKIKSNGEKTLGPLAELQAEIYSESNIDSFHMYSTSTFMADGKSYTSVEIENSSIIDAQISRSDTKNNITDIDYITQLGLDLDLYKAISKNSDTWQALLSAQSMSKQYKSLFEQNESIFNHFNLDASQKFRDLSKRLNNGKNIDNEIPSDDDDDE